MRSLLSLALVLLASTQAHAWNALGHRVVAAIAWQELDPQRQQAIVATLRRHPRFDEDFAKKMPADVDQDLWIFQQAAVWPDLVRGEKEFDHPTWHYINFPLFVGAQRPLLGVNTATDYPPLDPQDQWNVAQAAKFCLETLNDDASPSDQALAYCWLLHLIGDLHQPMHSTALFAERFPSGDRGGNLIPVVEGGNLHSLWDGLLGRGDQPNEVKRAVAELREHQPSPLKGVLSQAGEGSNMEPSLTGFEYSQPILKVDGDDIEGWIRESHDIAKEFAYSPEIISAVEAPGELRPISLPAHYLEDAGRRARDRIVAAGVRVAGLLSGKPVALVQWAKPPKIIPNSVNQKWRKIPDGKIENIGGKEELATVQFSIANHGSRSVRITRCNVMIDSMEALDFNGTNLVSVWPLDHRGHVKVILTAPKPGEIESAVTNLLIHPGEIRRLTVWLSEEKRCNLIKLKARFGFNYEGGVLESDAISLELHPF